MATASWRDRLRSTRTALWLAGLLLPGACAKAPPQAPMSQRARESALATSGLPGAQAIGAALRVSDSAAARRAREDSVAKAVP